MNIEKLSEMFSADVSPKLTLLDVQGRKNPILTPDRAVAAIAIANLMQDLGGTGRMTSFIDEDDDFPEDVILVYYRSHSGRPNKAEVARVAREIARSEVRRRADGQDVTEDLFVTGARAIAYADTVARETDTAVFMVSTTVWYNHNRSVAGWPAYDDQVEMFLDDINGRLTEGMVSIGR